MSDKKFYRLDISIAVEARNSDEAFETLVTDQTMKQIKELILKSKDAITEIFIKDENSQKEIIN